jgi:hypothetical protein
MVRTAMIETAHANHIPSHLSDDALVAGLKLYARHERAASADLIAHLVELETRELHLAAGFRSLFAYCCEELRLSEGAAFNRIEAARTARRFPVVLDMLAEGELSVTTVRIVGKVLTDRNQHEVLTAAKGGSKPVLACPAGTKQSDMTATANTTGASLSTASAAQAPLVASTARPAHVAPLAPSRYELRTTVSQDTRAEVKRAVYLRDLGCCAYVGANGRRCNARGFLEFHHLKMYALGAEGTVENTELRCAQHNRHEFKQFAKGIDRNWLSAGSSTRSGTGAGSPQPLNR